jgi:hypothetical protein
MDSNFITKVAYYPKELTLPRRILYVMVPKGEVTMDIWLDCLIDRVQMMFERKRWFRRRYANKICKILRIPACEDLDNLGRYIINYKSDYTIGFNSDFERWINAFLPRKKLFPKLVMEQDEEVYKDIQDTDLETWAGLVRLMTSGRLSYDHDLHKEYGLNKYFFENNKKNQLK